ncbi:MAG: hypothetical protein HKM93_15740 [Desulfobacteraceae bacterium]|nr:hypothetical protein [Desulfobacteraceae bacterium]
MILVIGEVLFDVFPDYRRLGGAAYNFAFHLKKMGFPVRFISRVGNDTAGHEILDRLTAHGFDPHEIQIDSDRPTGTVKISLDAAGVPTFDIVSNVAYDCIEPSDRVKRALDLRPRLLYFGSLIQRTPEGQNNLRKVLREKSSATKTFYDVNFRPGCYSREQVMSSLTASDYIKLNDDEVVEIGAMAGQSSDIKTIVAWLIQQFSIDAVILTRGESGGDWFSAKAHIPGQPVAAGQLKDTVGAGDAFAAVAAAGIIQRWDPVKTLSLANGFAARICGVEGALPPTDAVYAAIKEMIKII